MMNYVKAIVAAVGASATALLGVFAADTQVGKILTVVAAVATVIGVYVLPNIPGSTPPAPQASA